MTTQNPNDHAGQQGSYGGRTGEQNSAGTPPREDESPTGTGASGRENAVLSTHDADEALGNRTGGYGSNPATSDQGDGATGE